MTTLHNRSDVRLYQDWAAYRKAYGAFARFVWGWGGSFVPLLLPGAYSWRAIRDLRRDVLEDMK